jgi:hypothetical protein
MNLQGRNLQQGLTGDDVRLLHTELSLLSPAIPDSERSAAQFGPGTLAVVQQFQKQHNLTVTGIVDPATAAAINAAVNAQFPPTSSVSGSVYSALSAGVGGLRVQLVDKSAGPDLLLALGATDVRGFYLLQYSPAPALQRGKSAPDIQVRALAGDNLLGASDVLYDASATEKLDIVLAETVATSLVSEHAALTGAITAQYKGKLADLKETADRTDITYLANKTGWDAAAVALAALADQASARTVSPFTPVPAIAPPFFYALFRAGLPTDDDLLYRTDPKSVESIWTNAVDQAVIPAALKTAIPDTLKQFQILGAQKLLTVAVAGASPLKDMLAVSHLTDAQQAQFATLLAANRDDMAAFWNAAGAALGAATITQLQLDGKLAHLTGNNSALMQALRGTAGPQAITDPVQLVQAGYHRPEKWAALLSSATPVPSEIPGDTPQAKQQAYADFLAAQLSLSYPTATAAEKVKSGDFAVALPDKVHGFLSDHQKDFDIGGLPVERFIADKALHVDAAIVNEVKKLQRVRQITPSDQAMTGLLKRGIHAASHVSRFDKDTFVKTFAQDMGGADQAELIYERSRQIHHATLSIATHYLTARRGVPLGAPALTNGSGGQLLRPAPTAASAPQAAVVLAYPTLETLFGAMDFCACEHCRSVLSPAAYLVDLLHFIGPDNDAWAAFVATWKTDHGGAPYPFATMDAWNAAGKPAGTEISPLDVLLARRPDIQHLPLTCDNTNTALPYIDLVNETLEYFVANSAQPDSLTGYSGHDTNGVATEDLMASPQYVIDAAYDTLRNDRFPLPLPFHQSLEILRRCFARFDVPLSLAMERLRRTEDLERGANPFGWRDILMETLGLSREDYEILTNSTAVPLWRMYGFPQATADATVIAGLSNAKQFARRLGLSYDDLVALLRTRFINPNSDLIPKLEQLGVSFATLKALHDGAIADAAFDALLPAGAGAPDPAIYGGDIKAWIRNADNFSRIMAIVTLVDPTAGATGANFDTLELRFSKPASGATDTSTRLGAVEFVRLLRFIRLWKKTGWPIELTDAAICALYRTDLAPLAAGDIDTMAELDAGFLTLLPRLGIALRVMKALKLKPEHHLPSLLACWSNIGIYGDHALYRQMFRNAVILNQDTAFADNGSGAFLQKASVSYTHTQATLDPAIVTAGQSKISYDNINKQLVYNGTLDIPTRNALKTVAGVSAAFKAAVDALYAAQRLVAHGDTLRAAFGLTGDEFAQILVALKVNSDTALTLPIISAVYRRGWLARALRLSVKEFLLLIALTGLDPFALPDPTHPAIERLVALVGAMRERGLKSAAALYLIWNQDLSGTSAPAADDINEFARTLRGCFADIDDQLSATDDPSGNVARARMALVYGEATSDSFFALLENTVVLDVLYTHASTALEAAITAADTSLSYDNFRHLLAHQGLLGASVRDTLKAVVGVTTDFKGAVDRLFARSEDVRGSFLTRFPELKPLYDSFVGSTDRSALLAAFRPILGARRKRQQALQQLATAAAIDASAAQTLLDPNAVSYPLHADGHVDQPALNDVLALETPGLAAQFYFRATATDPVNASVPAAAVLAYAPQGPNPLPANSTLNAPISGVWQGRIETPEPGNYNFVIETDATATVSLKLDDTPQPLTQSGTIWRNTNPLMLQGGTLHEFKLTVENLQTRLSVQWETPKRGRDVIPGRYLYPPSILTAFRNVYIRLQKVAALASTLDLTTDEISRFAVDNDYRVGNDGWLNALAVDASLAPAVAAPLLKSLEALLDVARIKAELSADDDRLLDILRNPAATAANPNSALYALTRWDRVSLDALLVQFGRTKADLVHFDLFRRVYDAFAVVRAVGVSAAALIRAATNAPDGGIIRDFQSTLRARYAAADWRDLIKPINDEMRALQRDALVAHVLHSLRSRPATAQIDTPDKLFEYFLMDVQMEACMTTSRTRHALSCVQLFIERCLMNLEPQVSPAVINADQWAWMKRYRVWEANRKVFLWPENWLEPELRDDKSPFFKEIESDLLQADITEDTATTAYLNYLAKLEEVAKLEPCGMHYVEATETSGDVMHVVARTSGARRKYYYRRREFGYWTPWEQIKLDIEDNPVIPVVWKNSLGNTRLLLFWLRIIRKGPDATDVEPANKNLRDLTTGDLRGALGVTTQAVLCWSEYYNGKWQAAKTSDPDRPTALTVSLPHEFDRSTLHLGVMSEGDALRIYVRDTPLQFLISFPLSLWPGSFLLYNTHSLPVRGEDTTPPSLGQVDRRVPLTDNSYRNDFAFSYDDQAGRQLPRSILKPATQPPPFTTVVPKQDLADPWNAPMFFADTRHVFLVTTREQPVWVRDFGGYGIVGGTAGNRDAVQIPPLVIQPPPTPRPTISTDGFLHRGLPSTLPVKFGDRLIGRSASLSNVVAKIQGDVP